MTMQFQFNSDSSVMGTDNVAERIEAVCRQKLARFEDRLTRLEVHVSDENASKGGSDDKTCMIEARWPSGWSGILAKATSTSTSRAPTRLCDR